MKNLSKNTGGEGVGPSVSAKKDPIPAWENPLIPSKRLRQLYTAMIELRLLEEHVVKIRRRRSSLRPHLHEEGCLVSTVLSLNPGDLTSESAAGIAISSLRGGKLTDLLDRNFSTRKSNFSELPPLEDPTARLHVGIGAGLALASKKKSALVVAYLHAGDLASSQWKPILKLAAAQAAPILFVVLPCSKKKAKPGQLSLIANTCGVPGIPVDAADPIALYRVAQEAMLRVRAGGGPVLMECIPFQLPGTPVGETDPIHRMQQLLLPRGVATEKWFEDVATRFANRLNADGR